MPKLTEAFAAKLIVPTGKRNVFKFDDEIEGLFFRKFAESGETYCGIRFTAPNGKQRRLSLGKVTPGSMKAYRQAALDAKAKARVGQDVLQDRQEAKAASANHITFKDVLPDYLKAREKAIGYKRAMRPRSLEEVTRHLEAHCLPLHGRELRSLRRSDIIGLLDDIAEDRGPIAADRVRASVSTFMQWCQDRGKIDAHPATSIKPYGESQNARPLSESELAAIWKAADGSDDYSRIVRLAILSVLRRENIGSLEWTEVDLESREVRIPAAKMKNGREFTLPLCDQAVAILKTIPQAGRFVFGANAGSGFSGWSRAKERLCEKIDAKRKKPMEPWRLHGFRATFTTIMGDRDLAQPHIIDELLAHASKYKQGSSKPYNKATYDQQKRGAMQAWCKLVRELTA